MKLGIVGLPNAGKTTVFNALTHAGALATAYAFSSAEANHGVVAVPDPRLDRLNEVLQTPREVHATIEVVDIPGLAGGGEHSQGLGSRFLSDIREVDAVAHVVRAFDNPEVAFPRAAIDPVADVEAVETELILSDLELVERRRDKTAKAVRAGDRQAQKEMAVLERFAAELGEGRRAREIARAADDEPLLRDLALVTERPVLFVLNADEVAPRRGRRRWRPGRASAATAASPWRRGSRSSSPSSSPTRRPSFAPSSACRSAASIP